MKKQNWGYRLITDRDGRRRLFHVVIAEHALGREMPAGVQVHHVDYDSSNSVPGNLVICPNQDYHYLLHVRTDALNACGNANWRKCQFCKTWDAPEKMVQKNRVNYHALCRNQARRTKYGASSHSPYATHCAAGHEFSQANTYVSAKGWRHCRACAAQEQRDRRKQARESI